MFTNTRLSLTPATFLLFIFAYTNLIQAQITSPSSRPSKAMVLIPEGIFTMGSDIGPSDEKPKHEVFVKSFLMDVLPITNVEFAEFLNRQGLRNLRGETFYDDDDNDARIHLSDLKWKAYDGFATHPVNEVSWVGARDYCLWLKKRLPTEAEWGKSSTRNRWKKIPVGKFKTT